MRLVEIVRALQTSDETVERATAFAVACRKRTVLCVDTPGFIVNRINIAAMREAVRMAEAKEASYEDIDKAMVLGMRHPMGPLRLADFVGLVRGRRLRRISVYSASPHPRSHSVMESIYEATGEPHYAPPGLLRRMVQAGWLGVKSGQVRAPPPLTRRASTTTARRPSVGLVSIGPANERRPLTKPPRPFCLPDRLPVARVESHVYCPHRGLHPQGWSRQVLA